MARVNVFEHFDRLEVGIEVKVRQVVPHRVSNGVHKVVVAVDQRVGCKKTIDSVARGFFKSFGADFKDDIKNINKFYSR